MEKTVLKLMKDLVDDGCRISLRLGSKEWGDHNCSLRMEKGTDKQIKRKIVVVRHIWLGYPEDEFNKLMINYLEDFKKYIEKEIGGTEQ